MAYREVQRSTRPDRQSSTTSGSTCSERMRTGRRSFGAVNHGGLPFLLHFTTGDHRGSTTGYHVSLHSLNQPAWAVQLVGTNHAVSGPHRVSASMMVGRYLRTCSRSLSFSCSDSSVQISATVRRPSTGLRRIRECDVQQACPAPTDSLDGGPAPIAPIAERRVHTSEIPILLRHLATTF